MGTNAFDDSVFMFMIEGTRETVLADKENLKMHDFIIEITGWISRIDLPIPLFHFRKTDTNSIGR
ncbi:MAG TPA: hypothetical protein DCQ90_03600 [Erysipelotrichaceae bacterium]|nr:hypothetical protein [Erysipelotrichaceae bacterium]